MTGYPNLQESAEIFRSFVGTLSVWDIYTQPVPFTHKTTKSRSVISSSLAALRRHRGEHTVSFNQNEETDCWHWSDMFFNNAGTYIRGRFSL